MSHMKAGTIGLLGIVLTVASVGGCVRRTLTIQSDPAAALVYLNDEEVGRTPVTVDFTWYGDYDVLVRKEGFQTLRTHHKIDPPWYQIPPMDFVAEVLIPVTYHDRQSMDFVLEPEQVPSNDELLEQAVSFRQRALSTQE